MIGICNYFQISVYNHHSSAIYIRQQLQLAVYCLRAGVIQIILFDKQVAHDVTDIFHALHTVGNGTVFIVGNDHFRYNDTWYDSQYDQDDQNTKAETFKKLAAFFDLHSLCLEIVAHTPFGVYIFRLTGIGLNFFS